MKISIITVCKNSEKTISRTIESVLKQENNSYVLEYIIVDGASSDNTVKIIESYGDKIDIFISEPDNGIYDAMNKGIIRATGDVIGIINSDDWYFDEAVEKSVRNLQSNFAEISYGNMMVHEDQYAHYVGTYWTEDSPWDHMPWPHPTVFAYKSVYEKIGLFDLSYSICADYDWLLRCYVNGVKFSFIDENIANFSLGGLSDTRIIDCSVESYKAVLSNLEKTNYTPERKEGIIQIADQQKKTGITRHYLINNPYNIATFFDEHKKNKTIALYGAGYWGKLLYNALSKANIKVGKIIDSDFQKIGRKASFCDITVDGIDSIDDSVDIIVVCVRFGADTISEQLEKYFNKKVIYIDELVEYFSRVGNLDT